MKTRFLIIFFLILLSLSIQSPAQKKLTATPAPSPVTGGVMWENQIKIERTNWIDAGKLLSVYVLASARVVQGRLEFTGSWRAPGRVKAPAVTATLVATSARSANPWPGAGSSTARERRSAAQRERAAGEITEQTQSLYSSAETGSGCELLFLKITAPNQQTPIQVGVVLAPQDNERGNQINQSICRVVRALEAKENTDEAMRKLNQLISRE